MNRRRSSTRGVWIAATVLLGLVSHAVADDETAQDAELRRQLAQARQQIERRHAERERECARQFVVTPCVEASKAQRREALASLNAREAALDDAQRAQRAAARQARIDDKRARAADRPPVPLIPNELPARSPRPPREGAASAARSPRATQSVPRVPADVQAQEAQARAEFDAKTQEARQRQAAAAERQAQRLRSGKAPPAPLPPVGAASAPPR